MLRILLALLALSALNAYGAERTHVALFGIETDPAKIQATWKREKLEALATSRDAAERAEAAKYLGGNDDAESVGALATALSDRDARVRLAAARGLWKTGKEAAPARAALVAAIEDADPDVVAQAAGALQAIGTKSAELVGARKRVFNAPGASLDSRFLVARNLAGHELPARLLEPMIDFLERSSQRATGRTASAARQNMELADKALEGLVKATRDRTLITPLQEALARATGSRIVILKTLARFDPRPDGWTATLLAQLDSPEARVRSAALGHLRSVKSEAQVAIWAPRVAAMLADPDASVRSDALWALGNAAGLAAGEVEKVAASMADADASVRRSAARALGEMGEHTQAIPAASKARVANAARPMLTAALEKDDDRDVRDEAKNALAKLGRAAPGAPVALAAVAPASAPAGAESGAMAVLRARKVSFEQSSYFRALSQTDLELVRAFLDAGMSPKASLEGMGSPIRVMLFSGPACAPNQRPTRPATLAIVKLLIERGSDVNLADANGNTALMEAASKGCDRELIRTLIKAGARTTAVNGAGLTPFEMGLWMGHDGLEELIAAGYRLPPDKAKAYMDGYKDRPAAQAMIRKATRR